MKRVMPLSVGALLMLALSAAPAAAARPTITRSTDPPFDVRLADCGSYEIHERGIVSARTIEYADGTLRIHSVVDAWLYRTDDPNTAIGREHAGVVQVIHPNGVNKVTGNVFHIVIDGRGMTVHDVGRLVFETSGGFRMLAESGKHPVWNGEFDWATLCDL